MERDLELAINFLETVECLLQQFYVKLRKTEIARHEVLLTADDKIEIEETIRRIPLIISKLEKILKKIETI